MLFSLQALPGRMPWAEMMSRESLSLPCAHCLDSQLVWALPSAHLILCLLETQALLSQDTREGNRGWGAHSHNPAGVSQG